MMPKRIKALMLIGFATIAAPVSGTDYSEWSLALPAARRGFWDDADGDGVRNGLEYVAGTDALAATPATGVAVQFRFTEEQGRRQPRVEVSLPASLPQDVAVRLEVSEDLRTWVPLANRFGGRSWIMQQGTLTTFAGNGGLLALRWTGEGLPPGGSKLFYQVSAELLQSTDSDGDGLTDQWERQYGLNPASGDAAADLDGDGLSNLAEQQAGTHPLQADTDGDGVYDGCQVAFGQNAPPRTVPQVETGLLVLTP